MQAFIQWLLGTAAVRVVGVETEGFLNLCARDGVRLAKMARTEPFALDIVVSLWQLARVRRLAARVQCTVEVQQLRGAAVFLWGLRRRYGLVVGAALFLVLSVVGGQVILRVEVTGNETVSSEEILSQLRLCGVSVGTWGPGIAIRDVENRMLLAMDDLSFFSLNRSGTRAEVIVREKGQAPPPARQEEMPTDVLSAADGIITHIEAWQGDPEYMVGDAVQRGDILISGHLRLDAPAHEEIIPGIRLVHAEGRVLARTWHTLTASLPLTAEVKQYTGEHFTRSSLSIMGKRVKFYKNSGVPYAKYDIITTYTAHTPVPGQTLPVVWMQESYREYTLTPRALDPEAAESLLQQALLAALEAGMEEGEVQSTTFSTQQTADTLTVTLRAQCTEQIGRLTEMDTTERVTAPEHPGR